MDALTLPAGTLTDLSVTAAARLIATRKLSPIDLVDAFLDRIAAVDDRVKSYLLVLADDARAAARVADAEIRAGRWRGPLHGIPYGVKDNYDTAGIRTCAASRVLLDRIPAFDATAIVRLRAAGAILLGKLNTWEYGTGNGGVYFDLPFEPARNPWHLDHFTGGSSTGAGASVAAGTAMFALGSDTGGSIRLPAAACGVVGMKATYGRVSRHGAAARSWTLDHVGPLTRSVRDNARMLAAIAGVDVEDSTTAEKAVPDYEALMEGGVAGLRIGLALPEALTPIDGAVGAAVEAAAAVLDRLGARVSTAAMPDFTALYRSAEVIVKSEAAAMHRPWLERQPGDYANQVRTRTEAGFFIPATQYIDALRLRAHFVREFLDLSMKDVDAVMLPAIPFPIPTIEETDTEASGGPATLAMVARFTGLTRPFNTLGLPALSVPCGFDGNGLPIGLQLIGRAFDEALLYRIGHAYQGATDFHRKAPQ